MDFPGELISRAAANEAPRSEIRVDEEGDWYNKESRITREDIIELFLENVRITPDGSYEIQWNQSRCGIEVADSPFVVTRVDRRRSEETSDEEITLRLKYLSTPERLDPSTLKIGAENVLHCLIRGGKFSARFSRPAYYQLAQWIAEDPETRDFYVELNGRRHVIRT